MTIVAAGLFASTAFAAGQVTGALILVVIVGFAVRDQVRKRGGDK